MKGKSLSDFDDTFDVKSPRQEVKHAVAQHLEKPRLYNGFYTLILPDGSHRTFRIHTQPAESKFMPGKRLIGMLVGPDNTSDYEDFGVVYNVGITPWKRWRDSKQSVYAEIIWEIAVSGAIHEGCSLQVSRRCLRCNRPLTDPASIELGVGPSCRSKT